MDAMRKKITIFLCCLMILLGAGCQKSVAHHSFPEQKSPTATSWKLSNPYRRVPTPAPRGGSGETSPGVQNPMEEYVFFDDVFEKYIGEWVIGDLMVVEKVAYVAEEYARECSDMPGRTLEIAVDSVLLEGEEYRYDRSTILDADEMSDGFNIYFSDAILLCNGERDENFNVISMGEARLHNFEQKDVWEGYHAFCLVERDDETLVIFVGGLNQFRGFYELNRVSGNG